MKGLKFLKVFVCAILFVGVCVCGANWVPAMATISSPDINNNNYSSTYQMDKTLYEAIKAVAKQLNFNQSVVGFDSDIFKTGYNDYQPKNSWYEEEDPEKYAIHMQNIEDSNVIKADLNAGILDLTVGENAKYKCLQNEKLSPIESLKGFNELSLDTIKTLIFDDNQIKRISATDFEDLRSLQTLSVKNNMLDSVSFNTTLTKLNSIDFSGNKLDKLDFSNLIYINGKYPSVNLSNNQISDINNLVFPTTTKLENLNLNFNNLYELTSQQIEVLSNNVNGTRPVFLGVQSQQPFENLIAGTKVVVYNLQNSDVNELNVVCSYFEGDALLTKSDFYVDGQNNEVCQTLGAQQVEGFYAPAGKIRIVFYSGDVEISAENFPALDKNIVERFTSKVCQIALPSPTYTLKSNGKVVTDTYQESDVIVEFKANKENIPNKNAVIDAQNGARIYCGFDRKFSEDVKNTLDIKSNGTFSCTAVVVFDGITSSVTSVSVTRKNMSGIIWGLVIIAVLFVIGGAAFYITKWIREGGSVAPLTQKEIYNANRRKERKYGRERQNKYGQLDASLRHKDKENLDSDDLSYQNLNDTSVYNTNEQSDYNNETYDEDYRRFNNVDYNSYEAQEEQIEEENEEVEDQDFEDIDDGPDDIF